MMQTVRALEKSLAERYAVVFIGEKKCFRLSDGTVISLDCIFSRNAVVVEYAGDEDAAARHQFEDGDWFFVEQLGIDALWKAILDEIEA